MDKMLETYELNSAGSTGNVCFRDIDGKSYLVCPTTMHVSGVINRVYYSPEVLFESLRSWNGIPVPVSHTLVDGKFSSARSPENERKRNIGHIYNSRYEDDKLKGEIYIDVSKAKRLGYGRIVDKLSRGDAMDVSSGVMLGASLNDASNSNINCTHIAHVVIPDHLAILEEYEEPHCTKEMGCRVNSKVKQEGVPMSEEDNNDVGTDVDASVSSEGLNDGDEDRIDIVNSIIASKFTNFGEVHRKKLMGLAMPTLRNILPKIPEDQVLVSKQKMEQLNSIINKEKSRINVMRKRIVAMNSHMNMDVLQTMSGDQIEMLHDGLKFHEETVANNSSNSSGTDYSCSNGTSINSTNDEIYQEGMSNLLNNFDRDQDPEKDKKFVRSIKHG